jgi:hypothetical protein
MRYLEEAKQLDPFFEPSWYWPSVGIVHFIAGRYAAAITSLGRSATMPYWVQAYLAASHALAEGPDAARARAADVLRLQPDFSSAHFLAKEPLKRTADRQRLIEGLRLAGLPD